MIAATTWSEIEAEDALRAYAGRLERGGIDMAGWLDAALIAAGPRYEVVIAGTRSDLARAWNQLLPSWTVGVQVGAAGPEPELEHLMPTAAGKHDSNGSTHRVCLRARCVSEAHSATGAPARAIVERLDSLIRKAQRGASGRQVWRRGHRDEKLRERLHATSSVGRRCPLAGTYAIRIIVERAGRSAATENELDSRAQSRPRRSTGGSRCPSCDDGRAGVRHRLVKRER